MTRAEVLDEVWGSSEHFDPSIVDQYVSYVRKKLAATGADVVITTVRGASCRPRGRGGRRGGRRHRLGHPTADRARGVRHLSIRARITLGSVFVAAVVLVAIAFVLHGQVRATTRQSEVTVATSDLQAFVTDLETNPDETPDTPAAGVLVSIEAPDGRTLLTSMPRDLHEPLEHRRPADEVLRGTDHGTGYTIVGRAVTTTAGTYQVWAARSSETGDLTVAAIDRSLVVGSRSPSPSSRWRRGCSRPCLCARSPGCGVRPNAEPASGR